MDTFKQLQTKIESLYHSDIHAAVDFAVHLPESDPNIVQLKASTLVDGGYQLKSEKFIRQGITLFENLLKIERIKSITLYNLANGLNSLTILKWDSYGIEWKTQYKWYFDTIKDRLLAKFNYSTALKGQSKPALIAQIFNNRANILNSAFRWIEATHEYSLALKNDPQNGVAAGGIIKQIINGFHRTAVNKKWLPILIPPLYKTIIANQEYSIGLCGKIEFQKMIDQFAKWNIPNIFPQASLSKPIRLTPYQKFVFSNELCLSPFMSRKAFIPDLCDSLQIETYYSKDKSTNSEIPEIFAMFNVIKSDFLTTRWLAFNYFFSDLPKNSYYHDTLDYADYGTKPALLTITQRLVFDILDKIAIAILTLLGDKRAEDPFMSFRKAWFSFSSNKKVPTSYSPIVEQEIEKGNRALIALSELAFDIFNYYNDNCSYLQGKKKLRNSSTHRFTILHGMGYRETIKIGSIEHYSITEVEQELVDTLFLIKAAIIYFVEAVYFHNGILRDEGGKFVNLFVPSHKRIFGEKS